MKAKLDFAPIMDNFELPRLFAELQVFVVFAPAETATAP
jgi:hypothetical protein